MDGSRGIVDFIWDVDIQKKTPDKFRDGKILQVKKGDIEIV